MSQVLISILGWVGVALVLLAYGLVSTRRLPPTSAVYQWLNLSGAGLILVNSWYFGAFPSVGINAAWIGIATFALLNNRRRTLGLRSE
jgi:hypothetical protein